MLGIKQVDTHMTNAELYMLTGQQPIRTTIRKRQLKFTGDEPDNIYVLYKSEVSKNRQGRQSATYIDQISNYVSSDKKTKMTIDEITEVALDKELWNSCCRA